MNFIIMILSIVLMILIFIQVYNKPDIVKLTCIGTASYFSLFVVVSTFYFFMDRYQLINVLATNIIFEVFILLGLYYKNKKLYFKKLNVEKGIVIPLVIVIIMLPFTYNKFEFFGMGQDEGVYQTKAIGLMYGKTAIQQDFEEYSTLDDDAKSIFRKSIKSNLLGFYEYGESIDNSYTDLYDYGDRLDNFEQIEKTKMSEVSGVYHGNPNFSALLQLWGEMFGIENMQGIQTVFYIIAIFLIYFICNALGLSKKGQALATFVFAVSPITLWVSKSALTEMFLTVIFCLYIFFLVEKQKNLRWISSLFVVTFAFFHVSAYTIMPMFIIIYLIMYFYDRDEQYLYAILISLIGYFIGFEITLKIATAYIVYNYESLFDLTNNLITQSNLHLVILGIVILAFVTIFFIKSKHDILFEKLDGLKNIQKFSTIIIRVLLVGSILFVTLFMIKAEDIATVKFLTLSAYSYLTGFILIPIIYFLLVFKTKTVLENRGSIIIITIFMYVIVIYSCILRQEVMHYYYYARYLLPFIPVITILSAILLDKYKKYIIIPIIAFITIMYIPFDKTLATENDDSRAEWSILEDLAELIQSDDIVVMDSQLMDRFYLPLRAMTDAKMYPIECYEDINNKLYDTFDGEVYYLSNKTMIGNNTRYDVAYKNINTISQDHNELRDYIRYTGTTIPFPRHFVETDEDIILYKHQKIKNTYDFSVGDFEFNGVSEPSGGYVWIDSDTTKISCILDKKDYYMDIRQSVDIPLTQLNKKTLSLDVYINDKLIKNIVIDEQNNGKSISLFIDKQYIQDGKNIIEFRSELWRPSEYGSADPRSFGISLKVIEFREITPMETYDFGEGEDKFTFEGFAGNEGSFRWTDSNIAKIDIVLEREKAYEAKIYLITAPPDGAIVDEKYGYVTINDSDVKKELVFEVDKDYAGFGILKFEIGSDELTNETINTVKIHTDLWSPLDFGSADVRKLGIPIDKIKFTPLE